MIQELEKRWYAKCLTPRCPGEFSIGHIEPGPRDYHWACQKCLVPHRLVRTSEGKAEVGLDTEQEQTKRMFVLLEIPPQRDPIRIVIETKWHLPDTTDGHLEYFYGTHTCPTNWTSDIIGISIGDDTDPHGIARYVRHFDDTTQTEDEAKEVVEALLLGTVTTGDCDA